MFQTLYKTWLKLVLLLPIFALTACLTEKAPSNAPKNLVVTPGDGRVTLTWDEDASLEYWVFSAQADKALTPDNYKDFPESNLKWPARSGVVIAGLTNGKTYAFTLNSTKSGSPAGPAAPSVNAVPRAAGDAWTAGDSAGTANLNAVIMAQVKVDTGANLLAAGNGGALFTSMKGDKWTAIASGTTNDLRGLLYEASATRLIAVGAGGTVQMSSDFLTDKATWKVTKTDTTAQLNSIAAGSSAYVAVGAGGVILSGVGATDSTTTPATPTITWTARTSGVSDNLNKVAYLSSQFVVLGDGGVILTSPDGITWTKQTSGATDALLDIGAVVIDSKVNYLVIGAKGVILRSDNLTSWIKEVSPVALDLNAIAVAAGSRAVIAGQSGTILYGKGDSSWTATTTKRSDDVYALVSANGGYIGVGAVGTNVYAY
ncbi:hypothetical protein ACUHMQ_10800 [Chitinimonas sp. PSY-7]|uniref:hypothetical protein n=1 Tax=Chitinimonas sp. PSY-7 TaxID=3459088 RepID=UPI0040400D36